jgi:hypothetical protein
MINDDFGGDCSKEPEAIKSITKSLENQGY